MPKIRIAYLIDTIHSLNAGTEKQLLGIIQRLDRDVFEPSLICLRKSPWMEKNKLHLEVFVLEYRGLLKPNIGKVLVSLMNIIRRQRFQIIQTFFEDSVLIGYLGAVLSGMDPVLLSSRRDIGMGNEEPWYHALYKKIYPFLFKGFDGIVVNSESVSRYTRQIAGIPEEKIRVIHNGISVQDKTEVVPSIFQDSHADVWIGITANLKPIKRLDVFVQAFQELVHMVDNFTVRAIVLGEGAQRTSLIGMIRDYDLASHVFFVGSVDDVIPFLQNCDIGVLCSDREGFSNAIIEYMACGLPVVATRVGGNVELVDETNGICIPPGDPHALALALSRLCSSGELRRRLGAESKQKVLRQYSWDGIMNEWENYYHSVVRRGSWT